jgi:O-antigen ligase
MIERTSFALLCLFVFSLPWEKSAVAGSLGTASKVIGAAAGLCWAVAVVLRRRVRPPNLLLVLAAGFAAWSGATWLWSIDPAATQSRTATYVLLLAMAWLVWDLCRTVERGERLLEMYVAGCVVASLNALHRYAEGAQTYYRRYAAAGFDPNDFGITLALGVPMALYLAYRDRGPLHWLYRAAIPVVCAAILLTASRTALIATFFGFVFALWTWRSSDSAQRLSSVVLLLLLVAGAVWLAPEPARARLSTTATEAVRGTLHDRTTIWKAGLRAFKSSPLAGAGAGAYPKAVRPIIGVPARAGHAYVAHNSFLSVLVETGIAGFAVYAAMLLAACVFIWVLPSGERALWTVVLGIWAMGAAMLTWEHRKPGWLILALVMSAWARAFQSREPMSE